MISNELSDHPALKGQAATSGLSHVNKHLQYANLYVDNALRALSDVSATNAHGGVDSAVSQSHIAFFFKLSKSLIRIKQILSRTRFEGEACDEFQMMAMWVTVTDMQIVLEHSLVTAERQVGISSRYFSGCVEQCLKSLGKALLVIEAQVLPDSELMV